MHRILASALLFACLFGVWSADSSASRGWQDGAKENACVRCHSRLSGPAEMSTRFLDWRVSRHAATGVTCDKCHGGDAAARDPAKAHAGVLPSSDKDSRLQKINSPETCGTCHRSVVSAFVESKHYRLLKANEDGPSCISCHGHMASAVASAPAVGASLCTFCHNVLNGPLPQRPDIVRNAKSTLDAITRTNYMVTWISELLEQARKKKIEVRAEEADFRLLKIRLAEAKAGWHAFALETPAMKTGKSFDEAVRIKDNLSKKLGHD